MIVLEKCRIGEEPNKIVSKDAYQKHKQGRRMPLEEKGPDQMNFGASYYPRLF